MLKWWQIVSFAVMKKFILRNIAKLRIAIARWLDEHTCRVLLDGSDNSVSMSKGLIKAVGIFDRDVEGALIVKTNSSGRYAIVFKQNGDERIPMANAIQYNSKYKSIGFESLTPTVNRILNDYNLPLMSKQTLWVKKKTTNIDYWLICRKK